MNALLIPSAALTMSSMEIAELVEARHDNVRRTVERLAERGTIQLPPTEEVRNHLNQAVSVYQLGKRDSYVVVAQLSPEFTARLVDRWQQLEQTAVLDLRQPQQLLNVAAQLAQLAQEQASKLEAQKPLVEFAEQVGESTSDHKVATVAKELGVGPRKLWAFMKDSGIVMPSGLPYQQHMDRGRFRVVVVPFTAPDGEKRTRPETRVTDRGITYLQQKLSRTQGAAHAP